jgi:hypothetical protein
MGSDTPRIDTLLIDTLLIDTLRIDPLRINPLRSNTAVDGVVVSSRAMHHATDSHSMPIPEPRARCTRHDRVVSGARAAYMCAEAIRVQRVQRTPSNSLLDVIGAAVTPRSVTPRSVTPPP